MSKHNQLSADATVSVLLPIYNCQETLKDAVESVLAQTYADLELIIVNDGSTDQSLGIVEEFKKHDSRIKIINQPNQGIVAALNSAITEATGYYIARMDGDDISHPTRIQEQVSFLNTHPNVALLGTFYIEIPSGRPCTMPSGTRQVMEYLKNNGNALVHSSTMMRTAVCKELLGYRQVFPHCEDYDLWLRIAEHYEVDNLPRYLIDYRRHFNSISQKNLEQQFLSACGARRCAALRRNGFPDPATNANEISIGQLAEWGLRTDDLCTQMIEWLEWNKHAIPIEDQTTQSIAKIDQATEKYQIIRSEYRLKSLRAKK
jgi:glycosyltransferase involved in cell wall biosynthesis